MICINANMKLTFCVQHILFILLIWKILIYTAQLNQQCTMIAIKSVTDLSNRIGFILERNIHVFFDQYTRISSVVIIILYNVYLFLYILYNGFEPCIYLSSRSIQ